ncbi:MAG TPA: hypothetical protein VGO55_02005 [Allosphingosinicella sp.]|jgi:hypothetical protein|nr:hypothetical protein [Allosphingosinicella sp.]
MAWSDWFKSKARAPAVGGEARPRRFPLSPHHPFDLDDSDRLAALLGAEGRDQPWFDRFWAAVWTAALTVPEPPVFTGPDGFPYLRLDLPGAADQVDANSLANVAARMVEQGVGVAIFAAPGAAEPGYVMSMGVLDSILRFDDPNGEPSELAETASRAGGFERTMLEAGQQVLIGAPSEDYLSTPAARALHRHLAEGWRIADPRVALLTAPAMRPARSLVIGKSAAELHAEGVDDALIAERMRMLTWYLPPSRGLVLMPDDWSLDQLTPLGALIEGRRSRAL